MKKQMKFVGPPRKDSQQQDLTSRPMAGAFKGMRIGPECLKCGEVIDARPGWSLSNLRGSRKHQRHGWLHLDCEEAAAQDLALRQGKEYRTAIPVRDQDGNWVRVRFQAGVKLEVPIHEDGDQIEDER